MAKPTQFLFLFLLALLLHSCAEQPLPLPAEPIGESPRLDSTTFLRNAAVAYFNQGVAAREIAIQQSFGGSNAGFNSGTQPPEKVDESQFCPYFTRAQEINALLPDTLQLWYVRDAAKGCETGQIPAVQDFTLRGQMVDAATRGYLPRAAYEQAVITAKGLPPGYLLNRGQFRVDVPGGWSSPVTLSVTVPGYMPKTVVVPPQEFDKAVVVPLVAQPKCYEALRAEGLALMSEKKYEAAGAKFTAATQCPDVPAQGNDLPGLLEQTGKLALGEQQRSEQEAREQQIRDEIAEQKRAEAEQRSNISLVIRIFDKETKEPIKGITTHFRDYGSTKPDGTQPSQRVVLPLESIHKFNLAFNHRYRITATKAGYTSDSTDIVSTIGMSSPQTIEKTLYLTRGVTFRGWALNKLTRDTLYGVGFKLVELPPTPEKERFWMNPLGVPAYGSIVSFEKRYMFTASKTDYTSDSTRFTTIGLPAINFQEVTHELQLLPLDLSAYLPIKLYFDNDEPDKRTLAKTTDRQYQPTYVDYIRRKKEFIDQFTAPLFGAEKQEASDLLEIFFERDVRGGWNRLFAFSEALYAMLERGDYIVLTLRGFTSPRGASSYNLNLSSRRVSSVYNHFNKFDGGIYRRYIDNGQLVIILAPMGETNPPGVSDAINDPRRSLYSVNAARENRVEIIGVEVNKAKN